MNFLITGGAGFIGSHLAEKLISRGDQVVILDSLSTGSISNLSGIREKIKFEEGNVLEPIQEETYFYKFQKPEAYAIQQVYTKDKSLDEIVRPHHK